MAEHIPRLMIKRRQQMNGSLVLLESAAQSLAIDGNRPQGFLIDRGSVESARPGSKNTLELVGIDELEEICKTIRARGPASEAEPVPGGRFLGSEPRGNRLESPNTTQGCTNHGGQHGRKRMALSLTPTRIRELFECREQPPRLSGLHSSDSYPNCKTATSDCRKRQKNRRQSPRSPTKHIQCQILSHPDEVATEGISTHRIAGQPVKMPP